MPREARVALPLLAILAGAAGQGSRGSASPLVGIFSLPAPHLPGSPDPCGGQGACEVLPASYVRFVEAAGGRVVPVSFNADRAEVELLARSLNGFLFTGGPDLPLPPAARRVLEISRALHEAGEVLPVWGTCLGFEWLVSFAEESALQTGIRALNVSLPLQLTPAAGTSQLLGAAPPFILDALANHNTTFNMHHRGVVPSRWDRSESLKRTFRVLSTSSDRAGTSFVSTVEGRGKLPWYGVQWHPEKNAFEHGLRADGTPFEAISHGLEGVAVEQYMANFFVSQARRSTHRFADPKQEAARLRLICGRATSGVFSPAFEEVYFLHYPGAPASSSTRASNAATVLV